MENPLVVPFQLLKIQPPTCKYIKSLWWRETRFDAKLLRKERKGITCNDYSFV